jgi:hypothetical protein
MMESGFTIQTDELPAWETELINMIQNQLNQQKAKQQRQMQQKMKGGV